MIPFILISKLNIFQFTIFQVIQTAIHFILVLVFYYVIYNLLNKKNHLKFTKILIIAIIFEIVEFITVFLIQFLVILSAILYVLGPIFIFLVDLIVINLTYKKIEKDKTYKSLAKIIFLFIIVSICSFLISIIITNHLFSLFGIPNAISLYF